MQERVTTKKWSSDFFVRKSVPPQTKSWLRLWLLVSYTCTCNELLPHLLISHFYRAAAMQARSSCEHLSICLSVKRMHCDKTKALSEKSSIMTNRNSSGLGPKTSPGIFQLSQPTQIMWRRVLLLIRPPDINMSGGLKLYCCNFFTRLLSYILLHRAAAAHQMYIHHRFSRRVYSIPHSAFSPPLP